MQHPQQVLLIILYALLPTFSTPLQLSLLQITSQTSKIHVGYIVNGITHHYCIIL